jgi:hypothetical protein
MRYLLPKIWFATAAVFTAGVANAIRIYFPSSLRFA